MKDTEQDTGRETPRDALERLHYRTRLLLEALEKRDVAMPVWNALSIERAMNLAREALEREPSDRPENWERRKP